MSRYVKLVDGVEVPMSPEEITARQAEETTAPIAALDALEEIISQGQIAMSEAPLPDDLQKKIFDLEVFVRNYYQRKAYSLIRSVIADFTIPAERTDVTQGQRIQVEALKTQMLGAFNGN